MATNMNTSSSLHKLSNSVPSAPHPFVSEHDEHLNRLKASEATSSSSSSLTCKLNGLLAFLDCTDKMLQLATVQKSLGRESCENSSVEELLEGSLMLLDICGAAKDALLQSKESIKGLQSAFCRRRGGETALKNEGVEYLSSRKKVKKTIQKALESLKGFKKGFISNPSNTETEDESVSMISNIKEAEIVTLIQLESLLSFVSGSAAKPKGNKLTFVFKLMQPKRVFCESNTTNEFDKVDGELQCLFHNKSFNVASVESFQNYMENLELCIKDLESGIEHLERKIIRNRVSLLNIYNN